MNKLSFSLELQGAEKATAQMKTFESSAKSALDIKNIKDTGFIKMLQQMSPAFAKLNPELAKMRRELELMRRPLSSGGFVLQPPRLVDEGRRRAAAMGSLFPVPPIIPNRAPTARPGFAQLATSLAIAPFSPWVASRGLSAAFGGGGGGGVGGALFGGGGFGGFSRAFLVVAAALEALKLAIHSVRFALNEMLDGIKRGSQLFANSARVGTKPGNLFQLRSALEQAGISPDHAETLAIRGQYPTSRGGSRTTNVSGTLLGAGRGVIPVGDLQQIKNLSQYIEASWKESALDAMLMNQSTTELFNTQFRITSLVREWHTMWSQIATIFAPAINAIGLILQAVIRDINIQLGQIVFVLQKLGLVAKSNPSFRGHTMASGSGGGKGGSTWERLGFVIGGVGGMDYAKETAQNTKIIANYITRRGAHDLGTLHLSNFYHNSP